VKYTHPHYPGDACHPRCKPSKATIDSAAALVAASAPVVAPPRKRKRAVSDPGEPQNLSRLRIRAPRPAALPPIKKTRFKADPVDIAALLDQTVARRMALIEAEQNGTHSTSHHASRHRTHQSASKLHRTSLYPSLVIAA
jgi:hypothetical protein